MAIDLIYHAKANEEWFTRYNVYRILVKGECNKKEQAKWLKAWALRLKSIASNAFHSKIKSQEIFKSQQWSEQWI